MDRQYAKQLVANIDHIRAYADGADIQYKDSGGCWKGIYAPSFDVSPDRYRIKPTQTLRHYTADELAECVGLRFVLRNDQTRPCGVAE